MPEIQAASLPPDVEYIIDGAVDEFSMDGPSHFVLRMWGDRKIIMGIVDQDERERLAMRSSVADRLMDYADTIMAELTLNDRGTLACMGLAHTRHESALLAEILADWAISDLVEGGCMKEWNRPPRAGRDGTTPWKRDRRRLGSPAWIRRYVRSNDSSRRYRAMGARMIARLQGIPPHLIIGDVTKFDALVQEARARRQIVQDQAWNRITEARAMGLLDDEIDWRTVNPKPIPKAKRKAYRKTILRAASQAGAIVGAAAVSSFAQGNPVRLAGERIDFDVATNGPIGGRGAHALNIDLLDKAGPRLGKLCLYFEDTPALDQLSALKLHLDSGLESELLTTGNLYEMTQAGCEHALLAQTRKAALARPAEGFVVVPGLNEEFVRYSLRHDERKARNATYWQETQALWRESLGTFVLGRWAKPCEASVAPMQLSTEKST